MSNRYQLGGLKDEEILRGVSQLVAQGNELTSDVLAHLVEVDARMLYAELGFPNLFMYCVESLGLSEGAAGRRCAAARVCRRFPEAFELVATGDLHLSALCGLACHLLPENAAELFAACRRKTRRQVDEILAVRFPKPDAKESIRRLPGPAAAAAALATSPSPVAATVAGPITTAPERAPAPEVTRNPTSPRNREIQPTSAERYKVQFTADAKLRELIERACALCPGYSPDGQLANVVTRALELFVAQEEKRRFGVGRKPRKLRLKAAHKAETGNVARAAPPGGAKRRRSIQAADRRTVHERDQGRCAWVAKDGRRCAARARLQLDHVNPWSTGGGDDAANLRLLCPIHNRLHARHCFGAVHIAAKIAARRAAKRAACQAGQSSSRAAPGGFDAGHGSHDGDSAG